MVVAFFVLVSIFTFIGCKVLTPYREQLPDFEWAMWVGLVIALTLTFFGEKNLFTFVVMLAFYSGSLSFYIVRHFVKPPAPVEPPKQYQPPSVQEKIDEILKKNRD